VDDFAAGASIRRNCARLQRHAALGALARSILHDFRMHWAGVCVVQAILCAGLVKIFKHTLRIGLKSLLAAFAAEAPSLPLVGAVTLRIRGDGHAADWIL